MEYWYLRWFDMNSGYYTYIYRETNRQNYAIYQHKFIRTQAGGGVYISAAI